MFDLKAILRSVAKLINKRDILILSLLIVAYLLTRLTFLDGFPIFSDEGIYLRWAKVAWHDPSWRFISLTDGKQPLQTWGTIPFLKLFSSNALLAGRLFAVSTGFFALTGIGALLMYLFGKRAAFFGMLFYIFTPYFLFYDRLALVDSGVNAFFIWIFLFSIIVVNTLRLDMALLFGLLSGFGLLAKSSVRLFVGLSVLAPVINLDQHKTYRNKIWYIVNYLVLYVIGATLALLIYNIQRLSPFFHYIEEKNKTFLLTFSELIKNPFAVVFYNIPHLPLYIFWESAFIVSALGLIGWYLLRRKDLFLFLYFSSWIILPYIVIIFMTKVLFPRYIMFFATLLIMLAAYAMSQFKTRTVITVSLLLYFVSVMYFDYTIIADYKNIPLPPVDRGQYIEAWPAGWGMKEIMTQMRQKSLEKPVIILAEGNFGMAGDVLDVFIQPGDRINVKGYWPLGEKEILSHQTDLQTNYVYAVFGHRSDFPQNWPLKLIKKYDKPGYKSAIYLFELTK